MIIELFIDEAGKWRWRILDSDGRIRGCSGEGHDTRDEAQAEVELLRNEFPGATQRDLPARARSKAASKPAAKE